MHYFLRAELGPVRQCLATRHPRHPTADSTVVDVVVIGATGMPSAPSIPRPFGVVVAQHVMKVVHGSLVLRYVAALFVLCECTARSPRLSKLKHIEIYERFLKLNVPSLVVLVLSTRGPPAAPCTPSPSPLGVCVSARAGLAGASVS